MKRFLNTMKFVFNMKDIQHIIKYQDEENNFEFIIASYKNISL